MTTKHIITPRIGLGSLFFGLRTPDVRAVVGEPTWVDHSVPGNETWRYEALHLDVSFSEDASSRLTGLCVDHSQYTLSGRTVIGISASEVRRVAPMLRLGSLMLDNETLSPDQIFEFPECSVQLVCFEGLVGWIRWEVPINDLDGYEWPS